MSRLKHGVCRWAEDHALHGLLFCWIPAATYSPGFTVRNRRASAHTLASLVAHWAYGSLHRPLGALASAHCKSSALRLSMK